jgi:hypothetical protein
VARVAKWQAEAFSHAGFASMYVAGMDQIMYRYPGDNMGCWPIRTGVSTTLRDAITPVLDGATPIGSQGIIFRVWTRSLHDAKLVQKHFSELCNERYRDGTFEQMRKSYIDVGPDINFQMLQFEIEWLADRFGIRTMEESDMLERLAKIDRGRRDRNNRLLEEALR